MTIKIINDMQPFERAEIRLLTIYMYIVIVLPNTTCIKRAAVHSNLTLKPAGCT